MLALSVTPGRFSTCSSNSPHLSPHTPAPPPPCTRPYHWGGGGPGNARRLTIYRELDCRQLACDPTDAIARSEMKCYDRGDECQRVKDRWEAVGRKVSGLQKMVESCRNTHGHVRERAAFRSQLTSYCRVAEFQFTRHASSAAKCPRWSRSVRQLWGRFIDWSVLGHAVSNRLWSVLWTAIGMWRAW